jgi:mRNA interferase MazF
VTSSTTNAELPKRGEIWLVNFDPTVGAEIKKVRPAVVISSDAVGKLPIKLIAPITDWKSYFSQNFWHVKIEPDATNGLTKVSAIDALQLRGVDLQRFIRRLGNVSEVTMSEIAAAIVAVIEYDVQQILGDMQIVTHPTT